MFIALDTNSPFDDSETAVVAERAVVVVIVERAMADQLAEMVEGAEHEDAGDMAVVAAPA